MILPYIYRYVAQVDLSDLKIPKVTADNNALTTVLNIVFMLAGGLSVIFIIIGGLKYVLSAGDPQQTKKAKDTVLYAIIGLILSLIAFVIVGVVANITNRI